MSFGWSFSPGTYLAPQTTAKPHNFGLYLIFKGIVRVQDSVLRMRGALLSWLGCSKRQAALVKSFEDLDKEGGSFWTCDAQGEHRKNKGMVDELGRVPGFSGDSSLLEGQTPLLKWIYQMKRIPYPILTDYIMHLCICLG